MRPVFAVVMLLAGSTIASAEDRAAPAPPADVKKTIDRGLDFLARDAVAWRDEHKCVSCHHAALVVWSMARSEAARPRGR